MATKATAYLKGVAEGLPETGTKCVGKFNVIIYKIIDTEKRTSDFT